MRMLKRIAILSGAAALFCAIGAASIFPFAMGDIHTMGQQLDETYRVITEEKTLPADGIQQVSFTGSHIDTLRVRQSGDGQIHIYTDNYQISRTDFTFIQDQTGMLEIRNIRQPSGFFESFTRENLLRTMAAGINNVGVRTVEVHLPAGVTLLIDERHYGDIVWYYDIAQGIPVERIPPERPETPSAGEEGLEPVDSTEPAEPLPPISSLASEMTLRNSEIHTLYDRYYNGAVGEDGFWQRMDGELFATARLLAPYCITALGEESEAVDILYEYGRWQVEQSQLDLRRSRNDRQYQQGAIEKEVYYAIDLELDEAAESLYPPEVDVVTVQLLLQQLSQEMGVPIQLGEVYTIDSDQQLG